MDVDHIAFFAKLEARGEEAVRIDFAKGIYAGTKARLVQDWLRKVGEEREAAFLARSEAREDESLSISRKALSTSKEANDISRSAKKWAVIAIIVSTISAIATAYVQYISTLP